MELCPICGFPCRELLRDALGGRYTVDCYRCGKFSVGDIALGSGTTQKRSEVEVAKISGFIRQNPGVPIEASDIDRLSTPSVGDKAAKLLIALGKHFVVPGIIVRIDCQQLNLHLQWARDRAAEGKHEEIQFPDACRDASAWVAVSWAASPDELSYLLYEYLLTQGWLGRKSDGLVITPRGWQQIEDWKQRPSQSQTAFIAMSFSKNPDLLALFKDGIEPGVRAAGYQAARVDQVEHVNRIDDEIMAMIRKSKFIVADFTENRMGVYFEAGFAQGLGQKVIWTVREDHLTEIHFDTRQFNFIIWSEKELEAFATALQHRIEGTIGPGPLKQEEGI
jgi:hypothetical protein